MNTRLHPFYAAHIDPQVVYPLPGGNLVWLIAAVSRPALSKCIVRQVLPNNRHPAPGGISEYPLLFLSEVVVEEHEFDVEVALAERWVKGHRNAAPLKGSNMIVGGDAQKV